MWQLTNRWHLRIYTYVLTLGTSAVQISTARVPACQFAADIYVYIRMSSHWHLAYLDKQSDGPFIETTLTSSVIGLQIIETIPTTNALIETGQQVRHRSAGTINQALGGTVSQRPRPSPGATRSYVYLTRSLGLACPGHVPFVGGPRSRRHPRRDRDNASARCHEAELKNEEVEESSRRSSE